MNETCFEAINSNVLHHRTKSFHSSWTFRLQHDKACNMVNCPESTNNNEKLRSFKSKENIHKKEVGSYRGFGY